jgi:hypothetical protein
MNLFRRQGRRRRLPVAAFAGALFAFQALTLVGAQTASAAVACTYSAGVVSVTLSAAADTATFDQGTSGQIRVNAAQCLTATVSNTTTINVTGSAGDQTVVIDLATGSWGAINWTSFDLGDGTGDALDVTNAGNTGAVVQDWGASGIDLNGDGDLDITGPANVEVFSAEAGDGCDTINAAGSTITGTAFTHKITITGGACATTYDTLAGGTGNDVITGGTGYADVAGGLGDDTLDCTAGGGAVDYLGSATAVTVDLTAGTATGEGSDTITVAGCGDIEGSALNDTLTGDGFANDITGGAGDDKIDGLAATDTADFFDSEAAVTVDLGAGTATGDGNDTLKNMENVYGSDFGDTLTGNSGNNKLDGAAGSDWVDYSAVSNDLLVCLNQNATVGDPCNPGTASGDGVTTGNDTLVHIENATLGSGDDAFYGNAFSNVVQPNGGQNSLDGLGGGDTLDYSVGYDAGVEVNMAGGGTAGDSALNFENVIGTDFADTIVGSDFTNTIKAKKGSDNVRAGGGDDTVKAGAGNDLVRAGSGDDDLWGQKGNDSLNGGSGDDFCKGGPGKDVLKSCESGHK